jgi:hypothetical protein
MRKARRRPGLERAGCCCDNVTEFGPMDNHPVEILMQPDKTTNAAWRREYRE